MTDKEKTKDHQDDIPDDNASQATTLVPDTHSKLLLRFFLFFFFATIRSQTRQAMAKNKS
jgi:hypothetical protein